MFSVYEEQGKYFCHAPWAEAWSKSAEGRKREILNSGNNQSKALKKEKEKNLINKQPGHTFDQYDFYRKS